MARTTLTPARSNFLNKLLMASRKFEKIFDYRVRAKGFTLARARTLLNLSKKDGMNQADLAAILGVEGPTVVRLIDGMEGLGWLERRASPDDRRANLIMLTAEGRTAAAEAQTTANALVNEVLSTISDADLNGAAAVLDQVIEALIDSAHKPVDTTLTAAR